MARKRKKVETKDYDLLIQESKEKIEKISISLKTEKENLKTLQKNKIIFEKQLEEEKQQKELEELRELIEGSEKTFEEIKQFLSVK